MGVDEVRSGEGASVGSADVEHSARAATLSAGFRSVVPHAPVSPSAAKAWRPDMSRTALRAAQVAQDLCNGRSSRAIYPETTRVRLAPHRWWYVYPMLKFEGWFATEASELAVCVADGKSAVGWTGHNGQDDAVFLAETTGEFYSPIWRTDAGLMLVGHFEYADDDIEEFGGYEEWPDSLLERVGARALDLTSENSKEVGVVEVSSGCIALMCPTPPEPSKATAQSVEAAASEPVSLGSVLLVPIENGCYRVCVDELEHADDELGTFEGRIIIARA